MDYFSAEKVTSIHEQVVGPDKLQGMALNKSIYTTIILAYKCQDFFLFRLALATVWS